jgi:hypothetical protein
MERTTPSRHFQRDGVRRVGNWVTGPNLWRVGFHLNALPLIRYLSGLVDVISTEWDPTHNVVILLVEDKDATRTLFRAGALAANPVFRVRVNQEDIAVEANRDLPFLIIQQPVDHLS